MDSGPRSSHPVRVLARQLRRCERLEDSINTKASESDEQGLDQALLQSECEELVAALYEAGIMARGISKHLGYGMKNPGRFETKLVGYIRSAYTGIHDFREGVKSSLSGCGWISFKGLISTLENAALETSPKSDETHSTSTHSTNNAMSNRMSQSDPQVLKAVELVSIERLKPRFHESVQRIIRLAANGGLRDISRPSPTDTKNASLEVHDIAFAGIVAMAARNSEEHIHEYLPSLANWNGDAVGDQSPDGQNEPGRVLEPAQWFEWQGAWSEFHEWIANNPNEWEGWITVVSRVSDAITPKETRNKEKKVQSEFPIAKPTAPYKPDGWTQSELIRQVKERLDSFSDSTFRRIRDDAGLEVSKSGGQGQQRKYSDNDVKKLIEAAKSFRNGSTIAAAWSDLLPQ